MRDKEFETIFGQIPTESDCYQVIADASRADGQKVVRSDKVRAYEHAFMQQCVKYANRQILGQFRLLINFYMEKDCKDIGNAIRTVLGCLQITKAVADNGKCSELIVRKVTDVTYPRIEFVIQEMAEPMDIAALSDFLSRESVSTSKGGKL